MTNWREPLKQRNEQSDAGPKVGPPTVGAAWGSGLF
jgi:hypothetical protein